MEIDNLGVSIVIAVVVVMSPFLVDIFASIIKAKIGNSETKELVESVISIVSAVVDSTTQTFVDSIKKAGEFTEESAQEAFKISKENAISMITESQKDKITALYGNFEKWLDIQIEAAVHRQKK